MSRLRSTLIVFLLPLLAPACSQAQGFGQGLLKAKKSVILHRKLPAAVHLNAGTTLGIKAAAHEPRLADPVGKLSETLQAELLKYNNQFKIDDTKPETLVVCNITDLLIPAPKIVSRTSSQQVKVNNRWTTQQQTKQYKEITGTINVAYHVEDLHSGKVLDADNLVGKYNQEFDAQGNKTDDSASLTKTLNTFKTNPFKKKSTTGEDKASDAPPTQPELEQLLIRKVVTQVAARLTNTDETVEVPLARGNALEEYNQYADKGLWNRFLEPLETLKPLDTPEDDSFRLYNIGVGYEALAYSAENVKAAKKYLDEAAINYGKAVDANPHQKEFLEAQNRISSAQAHYAKLGSSVPAPSVTVATPSPTPSKPEPKPVSEAVPSPAPKSDGALNNAQIIEFIKQGLDEENLLDIIKSAPKVDFDVSPDGQLALVKAGVKGKVLMAIRTRAHATASTTATRTHSTTAIKK